VKQDPRDTIFAKILSGQIPSKKAYEDDRAYAFHDINPQAPVHVLVIPKKPIGGVSSVASEDEGDLGHLFVVARKVAEELNIAESGYRLVVNEGVHGQQSVRWIHVHVLGTRLDNLPTQLTLHRRQAAQLATWLIHLFAINISITFSTSCYMKNSKKASQALFPPHFTLQIITGRYTASVDTFMSMQDFHAVGASLLGPVQSPGNQSLGSPCRRQETIRLVSQLIATHAQALVLVGLALYGALGQELLCECLHLLLTATVPLELQRCKSKPPQHRCGANATPVPWQVKNK